MRSIRSASGHLSGLLIVGLLATAAPPIAPAAAETQTVVTKQPDGSCGMCVLAPSGNSLRLTGNASLSLSRSNLMVNSSSNDAISLTGNSTVSAPSVGVVGGVSSTGKSVVSNLTTGASPAPDPLAGVPIPAVATGRPPSVKLNTGQRAIFPGVYSDILVTGQGLLYLNAGTYVILDDFSVAGKASLSGRGVTIYLACSTYPSPCSTGQKGASLELTGSGRFGLAAPFGICSSGQVAIQSDPNNTSTISLSGNSADTLTGAIYAPSGTLVTSGQGGLTIGGQVVASQAFLNGNGRISVASSGAVISAPTVSLTPTSAGPDKLGSAQNLTATLVDGSGSPVANELVGLSVVGANTATTAALTNNAGQAALSYTGVRAGTDAATAFFGNGDRCITSNRATVSWIANAAAIANGPVRGNFYAEPASAQTFTATPADTALFSQQFPEVDFNPPAGLVPGNTSGVGPDTRPFTDVTTNLAGAFSGTTVAQGNGVQAGVGTASTFDAVLSSAFVVSTPGNVSFTVIVSDGFLLGVGNGATGVTGPSKNQPATGLTPFSSYPIMAAWNAIDNGPPAKYPVTIHFPSAGTYPYELDYLSRSAQLSLVLAVTAIPAQAPPLAIFTGYADTLHTPGTSTFPFPWQGAPGVTFIGSPNPDGTWDTGGLRFDNTTSLSMTLNHVTVDIGSTHFDPGWSNVTVPANGTVVLAGSGQLTSGLPIGRGGIYITGHDPDYHGYLGPNTAGAQHILQRAVNWVTFSKTTPKMLLVTDLNNPGGDQSDPRLGVTAAGFTYDIADDGSSGQVLNLHTVDFTKYDVVVVASDYGGWLRQTELDILNARSSQLISFVNGGGGLVALAECGCRGNGTGTTQQRFGYLPTVVSSAALNQAESGYTLTSTGTAMGLSVSDINGNASHNIFTSTGGLSPVDFDSAGHIISLAERGLLIGQSNFDTSDFAQSSGPPPTSGTCCIASNFATGFPNNGTVGPIGLAFDSAGNFYVGDYVSGTIIKLPPQGGSASNAIWRSPVLGGAVLGVDFSKSGRLYAMVQNPNELIEVDPATGHSIRVVTNFGTCYDAVATDPLGGDLFVTSACGGPLLRISGFEGSNPPVVTNYAGGGQDGMVFAPDGTIYAAQYGQGVIKIAGTNQPQPAAVTSIASVPFADGIAFLVPPPGQPVTKLIVNRNDGIITEIDTSTTPPTLTNVITGGSRGDFVTVGADGCLYATQSTSVEKVTFTDGSCPFVPTTPICAASTPVPQIHVTSNGQTTTFSDSTKVLAAGGHDAECGQPPSNANESAPWVQLNPGAPAINVPMPPILTLAISPPSLPATVVGKPLALAVTAVDSSGQAVNNLRIGLGITGANTQQLSSTTDSGGVASFSYIGAAGGTDTITATAFQGGALQMSNTVSTVWTIPLPGPSPTTTGQGAPMIFSITPADQTPVSAKTPISATVSAPPGFAITQWNVTSQLLPSATTTPLASGSGVPPTPLATFDPASQPPGTYAITISATSSGGGSTSAVTRLIIAGAGAGGSPAQASPSITQPSPPDGTVVTSPLPIQANFLAPAGQTIATWAVTYQALDPAPPVTLAAGTGTPPTPLATFDPTLLPNDTYAITISATSSGGGTQSITTTVAVWGNLKLGRYIDTFQDLAIPVNGFQMEVRRRYDSIDKSVGDFGVGWHVSVSNFRTSSNRQLGAGGWSEYTTGCFILCSWAWKTSTPHFVTVTWPDGHQEIFDMTPTGPQLTLIDFSSATVAFTARPGTNTSSTLQDASGTVGLTPSGTGDLVDSSGKIYNPTQFLLTTRTGQKLVLSTTQGLVSESDPNGNSLTIDGAGIHSSNGQSISFSRDSAARISSITDPNGHKLGYSYSTAGDLTGFTDANGNTYSYAYDTNHDLLSITGPGGGSPLVQDQFNSSGQLIAVTDANGNTTTFSPSVGTQQETVTDATGQLTTVLTFDALGDTVQMDEVFGGPKLTTTASYDSVGRPLTRTDPSGNTWTGTYDSVGDTMSVAQPSGHAIGLRYDTSGHLNSFTDTLGNGTSYAYDGKGDLTSLIDALGKTTSFTYDARGHVLSKIDPLGRKTSYAYDSTGHQTSVTDPRGLTTASTHDANGDLLTSTNPLGQVTTMQYDANGNLVAWTDPAGAIMRYAYDSLGRLASKTDQAGQTTTYAYDSAGNLTAVTDPLGRVTRYTYDADARLISLTDPTGAISTSKYDGLGRLIASTDRLGRTTSYGYDASGRLVSQTMPNGGMDRYTYDVDGHRLTASDALGRTTTFAYDKVGRLVSTTDPLQNTTSYALDALGRQAQITDAAGGITKKSFDAAGQLVSITDPLLRPTSYTYDADGNRASVTDALGNATYFAYDPANRLATSTDPLGHTTTYAYDANGRLITMKLPSGSTTTRTYDPRGLLTSVADALGDTVRYTYDAAGQLATQTDARGATTTFGHDAAGRQVSITDALGGVVHIAYDAAGERTSTTNPRGDVSSYTYDALGNVATQTNPAGGKATNSYDVAGELVTRVDPRGITTTYSYDADGHQTRIAFPGGSIANVYDALGRKTQMVDPTGTTKFTYDAASELLLVTATAGAISYTYDAAGRRASMTLPGSRTVQYGYDSASHVTQVTDWLGNKINFTYTADGLPGSESRPNGITTTDTYDSADRLLSEHHDRGGGPMAHYDYTLDANGNRTSMTTAAGTETYTTDALNRITRATYPNGDVVGYTYDAAGNRTSLTVNGVATNYSYNSGGELITLGGTSLSYDAAGDVTKVGANNFTWDWNQRLASAMVAGTSSSYTYDGDGVRVAQTVVAATTNYVVDRSGALPTVVFDGANGYLQDTGPQAQVSTSGIVQYGLSDALGSVRQLTDSTGNVTASASYDVFGGVRSQSGGPGLFVFGFAGEQTDSTGLLFLRSRYLDSSTGRFLSADALQPSSPGTQGYNAFSYATNNPTTLVDPSGHGSSIDIGLIDSNVTSGGVTGLRVGVGTLTREELDKCLIVAAVETGTGAPPTPTPACPEAGPLISIWLKIVAALALAIVGTVATAQPAGEPGTQPGAPPAGPTPAPSSSPQPAPSGGGAPPSTPPPGRIGGGSCDSGATPEDLYAAGNAQGVNVRAGDVPVDTNGNVAPTSPPTGQSTFNSLANLAAQGLTGVVYRLPAGTQLPDQLLYCRDGADVGGNQPSGHRTLGPSRTMRFDDFANTVHDLPWERVQRLR